jgi:RIO-like serine/threonine protein kinase
MVKCGKHDIIREIYEVYKEPDIAVLMKIERLGRTSDQNDREMSKRIMDYNPEGKRKSTKARSKMD